MPPAPPVMTATFPLRSKSSEAFIGQSFLPALTAAGSWSNIAAANDSVKCFSLGEEESWEQQPRHSGTSGPVTA